LTAVSRAALPPRLLEQLRQLERGELDAAAADAVRGQLQAMAGIVYYAAPVSSTDQTSAPAIPASFPRP